jgi:hypothetical protein
MLSPYIHAALARERHQEFLARAETDRRAGRRACAGCAMAQAPPADRRGAGALPDYGPARAACPVTGRGPR